MKKRNVFIVIIVLLLLIGVIVGIGAWHTQGFRYWGDNLPGIQPQKMQLSINGEIFSVGDDFPIQNQLRVDVSGVEEFNVTVVPGDNAYFDFKHNGILTKFPYIDADYNVGFGIIIEKDHFIIDSNNRSIRHILQRIFPGEEITDVSEIDKSIAYFKLKISSKQEVIEIPLYKFFAWIEVTIDPPEIQI